MITLSKINITRLSRRPEFNSMVIRKCRRQVLPEIFERCLEDIPSNVGTMIFGILWEIRDGPMKKYDHIIHYKP